MGSLPETLNVPAYYSHDDGSDPQLYTFSLRVNSVSKAAVIQTIDIIIKPLTDSSPTAAQAPQFQWPSNIRSGLPVGDGCFDLRTLMNQILRARRGTTECIALKLFFPRTSGYVAQSNIIQQRLHACPDVEATAGFLQPAEYIEAFTAPSMSGKGISELYSLLSVAIGASVAEAAPDADRASKLLQKIEQECQLRLTLQFLMPQPIERKRIGFINCLDCRMSLEVLLHLNMDLIVFDHPGACMEAETGPLTKLRVSFHVLDINADEGFAERLYLLAKDLQLDGLVTRYDAVLHMVSQVAMRLNLPTLPPAAYAIATDKHLTRTSQPEYNDSILINSRQELEERLRDPHDDLKISYPVVVKPRTGHGSYGVAKAQNEAELLDGVQWAGELMGFTTTQAVIEPYCDGPEIDINIAMWDGEVTFFDVSDNAPTAGDLDMITSTGRKDFQEGLFMYPSQLPMSEQDMVCDYMHKCILRMGFRSGVFHCEARIKNSSMHYVRNEETGIVDLETNPATGEAEPSVFLLEVNPRPPGYFGLYATTWTHGVDLWVLDMLLRVGDERRFRALSVPFPHAPQQDRAVLLIMPEKRGILRSGDPMPALRRDNPELAACVPFYFTYFEVGQKVTPPEDAENCFTAIVVVETQKGRADLMRTVEELRVEWAPTVE